MGTVGYILLSLLGILVLLLCAAAVNAVRIKAKPASGNAAITWDASDERVAGERLAAMIQVPTVSPERGSADIAEFRELQRVMRGLFPNVHETCELTDIEGNLIYRWKGKDSSRSIVLMGHQDVVPATEPNWTYPPFSGVIKDGIIYGRGAVDCKDTVMAELSAMEELIADGFVPECDVYMISSLNEENSGGGAELMAAYLKERGVSPEAVLDEGGIVADKLFPGLEGDAAVIGLTEKGFIDLMVRAKSAGGHASTPPRDNPVARLAAFIAHMEQKRPFTRRFSPVVLRMFSSLAPHLAFPMRFLFGNMWLFAPLMRVLLPMVSPFGEALISTTFCFTMCGGSSASNVIPAEAYAVCNLRCIAHQDMEDTIALFKKEAAKFNLEVEALTARNSSNMTDPDGGAFKYLERCIHECMPGVAVAPYLLMGGTDCREFESVSRGCLRFTPMRVTAEQMGSEHSADERIPLKALAGAVKFYRYYIENYR